MENALDQRESAELADGLPVAGLLALASTGFIAILTGTLPAGLLPQIAMGLHVSLPLAGQLVTLYAAGSVAAAVPLTAATQGWRRKRVLLLAIVGFLVFNTMTAVSSSFLLTLLARFLAGVAAGLTWGITAGYARRMLSDQNKGKGMAIAMVGTPLALALGVPAGTFLGNVITWRAVFLLLSAFAIPLIGWVIWKLPDFPGQTERERLSVREVLSLPGLRSILTVMFLWMVAHNILYTYIAPFAQGAGLGRYIDLVLLIFGATALVGIWLIGLYVDRWLRLLVLWSLGCFVVASFALSVLGTSLFVVCIAIALWGWSFGGAATLLQTASADAAGTGVDLAQAVMATLWNLAIAIGGVAGGVLVHRLGSAILPEAAACTTLSALVLVWRAHTHGFPREGSALPP